jgi:hypothetical protein
MKKKSAFFSLLLLFIFISTTSVAQWVQKANAQKKRSETTSVVYNNKLYTFLGFSDSLLNVESSSEVYNPATNTWTLLRSLPANKTVTHQGIVLIDDNVWHIGGRVGKNPGPLTSETWIYNITSDTWSAGPQLRDPATGQALLWGGGGAALLGRTLHVFGGFTINTCNNDQSSYHLTLDVDAWLANPSQPAPWKNSLAPLPIKRNHFGTVVLGGKIYALGGQFGHDCGGGQDQRYAHVYNPATDAWTQLPLLPTPRSHIEGAVFAMDGKIYILAGQATNSTNTNKVTIFDPAGNSGAGSWADNTSLTLPKSYEGLSSKVIGSTIYASHGGEGSSRNTRNTTYARTITRTPVYKFGFSSGCASLKALTDDMVKTKTLLFTIDGTKTYSLSSSASWLTVSKNATGTAVPNAVDIELTAKTSGLAPGSYNATLTATGTGSGPAYTAATYCITLTVQQRVPEINTTPEVVLSGVKGTLSAAKPVIISNSGTGPLQITGLTISGTHATAFRLSNPPALPFSIPAGQHDTLYLQFTPSSTQTGALSAALSISNNDENEASASVGLYGLSANGEQGSNEPPLDGVVKTVGYAINVGGTSLILSTSPNAIGDEVLEPLFLKAGTGPVTMKAVARYSPDDLLPFGYYIKSGGTPVVSRVGTIALNGEQTLYPALTSDSKTSFDPGSAVFGFYAGATSYAPQNTYTEDALNTGPLAHSVRIYPLKNRAGAPMPNSYLVAFEPASNGDYQDYVFEVTNVKPATASSAPIRINTGGPATTVNGISWMGCSATGSCSGYVSGGGFPYTQSSSSTITGITPPTSVAIMQTEWTGGATGGTPVAVGQVAFTYTIPVANGDYTVRLHFAELNKNGAGLRKFDVNIEGGTKELANFDIFVAAGGMNKAIYRDFPVTVSDGDIKIEFYRQVQNAKISAIEILAPAPTDPQSGTLEAETAVLYKAIAASNRAGYTGSGFADYINSTGDYVEWTVHKTRSGPSSLRFRYANGSKADRPLKVEVNGVVVAASLSFPVTGAWDKWATATVAANLVAGSNRVRLTSTGSSGANIDHLNWSDNTTPSKISNSSMTAPEQGAAKALAVAISPNPVSAMAELRLHTASRLPVEVSVVDVSGKVHKRFSRSMMDAAPLPFSVEGFPAGLYIVFVKQGKETASARFVVEKK